MERVRSDEAEGILSRKTVLCMVDGESGRSFHRKDLDDPWQQKQDRPRKRMGPAHFAAMDKKQDQRRGGHCTDCHGDQYDKIT